jgi:hypothetical protein
MARSQARPVLIVIVCVVTFASAVPLLGSEDLGDLETRIVEVGLAIERQIELARLNHEQGTLDQATLERQADVAETALENLRRRVHSLPDGATDALLTKLHAVHAQAANLARAAELGSAPPRRQSTTERVKHFNRRGGGTRAVPANDNCEDAFVVGFGSYAGDTTEATNDGGAACGSSLFTSDVWYRFVPVSSGNYLAETAGSAYDTVLSVHTDCPGTLSNQIACNDDSGGLQSKVVFWASTGSEVLIRVSGNNGAVGSYHLAIDLGGAIEGMVTDTPTGSPVDTWIKVYDVDGFQV